MYAHLILPLALQQTYTYLLPRGLEASVKVGSRVIVQFGARRHYTGIVASLTPTAPAHDAAGRPIRYKEVEEVCDAAPMVSEPQLRLWKWAAQYYMCTPGEVMKAAMPAGLKPESETLVSKGHDTTYTDADLSRRERLLVETVERYGTCRLTDVQKETGDTHLLNVARRLVERGVLTVAEKLQRTYSPRTETRVRLEEHYFDHDRLVDLLDSLKRAPAQEKLLAEYLDLAAATPALKLRNYSLLAEVSKATLCRRDSGAEAALSALRRKKVLTTYAGEVSRLASATTPDGPCLLRDLDSRQRQALDSVREQWQTKDVCLLHGVTGSGKTEVYIHLIKEVMDRGGQVLYLLPEIALTTQITQRLGRVFGGRMGVYHSRFPDTERVEVWRKQLSDEPYGLILGVRSALFLPAPRLRLIIVDEEHEASYKQQDPAPRYHARDLAIVWAQMVGAKVLLGSATPSLETFRHAREGKYGLVSMTQRYGGASLPHIVVEDVKELRRKKRMPTPFSPRLIAEVKEALARGEQAILFQNRRGYSPVVVCRQCGWTPRCTHCDVTLTYHRQQNNLVCHYCGTTYRLPESCPACESTALKDLGYGTEKIEAAVGEVFPGARTARMDLDTTRSRSAYDDIINNFSEGRTDLLIGTQMVTKGLDFDRVRVVGVMNADQMLNQPDFRAYERAYQMLSQVAGRAGRKGEKGLVVIQTGQPDLPVVDQVVRGDYEAMYRDQMAEREYFHYPPFYRLIAVWLRHRSSEVVDHAAQDLATLLRPRFGEGLLGPDKPAVGRVQSLFLRKLLLKVPPHEAPFALRQFLLQCSRQLTERPAYHAVSIVYDVDPL